MVGGPSLVYTRKVVVGGTFIRDSTNLCKSTIGIDASQLYPFSMCQAMPTGLYTRWELDLELGGFKTRQTRRGVLKTRSFLTFNESEYKLKWKVNARQLHRNKLKNTVLMAFVDTATMCLKLWDVITIIVHVRKLVFPSLRKKVREALKRES